MVACMECPSCQAEIDADSAICPHCDAIVDASAFDDSPRPSKPAPAKRPGTKSGVKPVARKAGVKKPAGTRPKRPAPQAPPPSPKAGDWRSRVDPEDWNQMPASQREPEKFEADPALDPDDLIGGFKQFVLNLSAGDKLVLFGSIGTVLSCFFPWKETVNDGDVIGLGGPGLVTFFMSCATMTVLTLRVNKSLNVNELLLWAAQLGTLSLGVLFALVSIVQSWDPRLARAIEGNQDVWFSKPSFGVFLAVLSGALTGFGTVLGLKAKA